MEYGLQEQIYNIAAAIRNTWLQKYESGIQGGEYWKPIIK